MRLSTFFLIILLGFQPRVRALVKLASPRD